jgi:uncharacterized protein DUF4148
MQRKSILNRSFFAALLLSASVSAFARTPTVAQASQQQVVAVQSADLQLAAVDRTGTLPAATSSDTTDPAAAPPNQGKTRAQVRAELIQAEQQGLVPAGNTRYPAGPDLIARNAYDFQQAKAWWETHGQKGAWGG